MKLKAFVLVLGFLSSLHVAKAEFVPCPKPKEIESQLKQIKETDKWKLKNPINGFGHEAPITYKKEGKPTLSHAYKTHRSLGNGNITLWCDYNFEDQGGMLILHKNIPYSENTCCHKATQDHKLGFDCVSCLRQHAPK